VDEYGSYLFKETYDEYTPFRKVSLLKQDKKDTNSKSKKKVPQKMTTSSSKTVCIKRKEKPYGNVTKEKINNLKAQLKYVKEEHRWFYEKVIQEQEGKYKENEVKKENEERELTRKK
jgi:hypothetical protein